MKAPRFWHHEGGITAPLLAPLLTPLSWLYRAGAAARAATAQPWQAPVPVLCVGNLVAGGAGKTPTALALGRLLGKDGLKVAFLSRGHGGRERGPLHVRPDLHDAGDVGDEPLLLAEAAPTWIARERAAGARMAAEAGADIIVMDDGFQNPTLGKSASVLVIDGAYGFGNGRVLPAGPLREPVAAGLARADAVILLGQDRHRLEERLAAASLPVLRGSLTPTRAMRGLRGEKAVAFAGIGRPEKFFATLETLGVQLLGAHAFPDHHRWRGEDLIDMVGEAERRGALLLTTAKDHVRLPEEMRLLVRRVDVELVWQNPDLIPAFLQRMLAQSSGPAAD